jgi:hypothetical protein
MVPAMSGSRDKLTIPPELEAEMTPAVRAFVLMLLKRIESLEAEADELNRRLGQTPQNSSLPPSPPRHAPRLPLHQKTQISQTQRPKNQKLTCTHSPAGLSEVHVTDSLHAPPIRCSVWFGVTPLGDDGPIGEVHHPERKEAERDQMPRQLPAGQFPGEHSAQPVEPLDGQTDGREAEDDPEKER